MIRHLAGLAAALLLASPVLAAPARTASAELDVIAEAYVHLTLEGGAHDDNYVDAYYGPADWAAAAKAAPRTLPQLEAEARRLEAAARAVDPRALSPLERRRQAFLAGQLRAAATRLAVIQGREFSFLDEAENVYGVRPVLRPLDSYDPILARIDALVPGEGDLATRIDAFNARYVIPADKLEPVMRAAIAECRARTLAHIALPPGERFDLKFVQGRPWSGYNWYKGGAHSLIQVNTELPVFISRAVDLGCHEGYPGHHVENSLLQARLAEGRGWIEFTVFPVFGPESLIADATANYGIQLAFPGDQKLVFERDVLYPLAGLDPASAAAYDALMRAKAQLASAEYTIADAYLAGRIDRATAVAQLRKYQLMSVERAQQRVRFIDTYHAHVINYGLGQDMVRAHVEKAGADPAARWDEMERLLSSPTTPADLN